MWFRAQSSRSNHGTGNTSIFQHRALLFRVSFLLPSTSWLLRRKQLLSGLTRTWLRALDGASFSKSSLLHKSSYEKLRHVHQVFSRCLVRIPQIGKCSSWGWFSITNALTLELTFSVSAKDPFLPCFLVMFWHHFPIILRLFTSVDLSSFLFSLICFKLCVTD